MAGEGWEAIDENEVLLRCIPLVFMTSESPPRCSRDAFLPKRRDLDGLSLFRAKYETPASASALLSGKSYYVAELRASVLMSWGLTLQAQPSGNSKGHAVISNMNADNRNADQTQKWAKSLVDSLESGAIHGPFQK